MKQQHRIKIIELIISLLLGFITASYYYGNKTIIAHDFFNYFFMPAKFIGMALGGGPHGNMSILTVGIGTAIQFYICWVIIKNVYKFKKTKQ